MRELGVFRGVNSGGLLIRRDADVTALALLFERVYLPRNLEIVKEFARTHRIDESVLSRDDWEGMLEPEGDGLPDPLADLRPEQRDTVLLYLLLSHHFAIRNMELYGPVFETDFYEGGKPFKLECVEKLPNGMNRYSFQSGSRRGTSRGARPS